MVPRLSDSRLLSLFGLGHTLTQHKEPLLVVYSFSRGLPLEEEKTRVDLSKVGNVKEKDASKINKTQSIQFKSQNGFFPSPSPAVVPLQ